MAACEEERFSRRKNDKAFPLRSLRWCLKRADLTIANIGCIAYYEDPVLKLGRQIWTIATYPTEPVQRGRVLNRIVNLGPIEEIRRSTGYTGRIEISDHHSSHAASSYYFSGFREAAILTVDGIGDWPSTTYNSGEENLIKRLEQVDFPHSLGFLYSAITSYLGFEVNDGEYKVMGLAPYGCPRYAQQIFKIIKTLKGGQFELDLRYFDFIKHDRMYSDELCELFGAAPRQPGSEITQFHKDVARSVQFVLEEILLEKVRHLHSMVPSENLCMAGGVSLNVVANSRCLRDGPFRRLFIQPAAGNSGAALGAAAIAYVKTNEGHARPLPIKHVYLGPAESTNSVFRLLRSCCIEFLDYRGQEKELLKFTAEKLAEGKIIGWFQGSMEFGPRALGARSILADARRPEIRDKVNSVVKMREQFRPFAPVVLQSEAHIHFNIDHPSPFMLETCRVISSISLPAITHVDGSARVQTIDADTNPRLSKLLAEFRTLTGCPILLNTSLNIRGDPIVRTAKDAMLCFAGSQLDFLIIEDFVLSRSCIPPGWQELAQMWRAPRKVTAGLSEDSSFYTLF